MKDQHKVRAVAILGETPSRKVGGHRLNRGRIMRKPAGCDMAAVVIGTALGESDACG